MSRNVLIIWMVDRVVWDVKRVSRCFVFVRLKHLERTFEKGGSDGAVERGKVYLCDMCCHDVRTSCVYTSPCTSR